MSFEEEFKNHFGGFLNKLFLIVAVVVNFIFAGAVWAAAPVETRLLRAVLLLLGSAGIGVALAVARIIMAWTQRKRYGQQLNVAEKFAWGLKYGLGVGTVLVLIAGLTVPDFLRLILELWKNTFGAIIGKIP